MGLADCQECGRPINGDLPAVGLWTDGDGIDRVSYVPFVEDLRTTGYRLVHLDCYAKRHGVESLVEAVHEHDRRVRKETWDLIREIGRLKTERHQGE
jgi:hypothetical protein